MKTGFKLLLFTLLCNATAAQVIIEGNAESLKNKEIRAYFYNDYLTLSDSLISTTKINSKGEFKFKINEVKDVELIKIQCANFYSNMYVYPGLFKISLKLTAENLKTPVFKSSFIDLYVNNEPEDSINYLTNRILYNSDSLYYSKLDKSHVLSNVIIKPDYSEIIKNHPAINRHPFLNNFYNYTVANHDKFFLIKEDSTWNKYIQGKDINFKNDAQIIFLKDFYNSYLGNLELGQTQEISSIINKKKSLERLLGFFRELPLVKDSTLAYFNAILILQKAKYDNSIDNTAAEYILEQIINNAESKGIVEIAQSVLSNHKRLSLYSQVPKVDYLSEIDEDKIRYLYFWTTWSEHCLKDIEIIRDIQKEYNQEVVFELICLDESMDTYESYVNQNEEAKLNFYFEENPYDLAVKYNVHTVPSAYILSFDGYIIQSQVPMPSDNLTGYLNKVRFENNSKNKIRIGER